MNEEKQQRKATIATLLHQTAEDHHVAFKETDGVDPDWSIWFAGHLLENLFLGSSGQWNSSVASPTPTFAV